MNKTQFNDTIDPIIFRFHGSETSGIRSVKRNAVIKGHRESRHLYGLAKDVVLDEPKENKAFIKECRRQGLKVVPSKNCIHVQTP